MAYSKASYKASLKYRANHIKRVALDMQISEYVKVKAHSDGRRESVNGFIKRAIQETMERDNGRAGD